MVNIEVNQIKNHSLTLRNNKFCSVVKKFEFLYLTVKLWTGMDEDAAIRKKKVMRSGSEFLNLNWDGSHKVLIKKEKFSLQFEITISTVGWKKIYLLDKKLCLFPATKNMRIWQGWEFALSRRKRIAPIALFKRVKERFTLFKSGR